MEEPRSGSDLDLVRLFPYLDRLLDLYNLFDLNIIPNPPFDAIDQSRLLD